MNIKNGINWHIYWKRECGLSHDAENISQVFGCMALHMKKVGINRRKFFALGTVSTLVLSQPFLCVLQSNSAIGETQLQQTGRVSFEREMSRLNTVSNETSLNTVPIKSKLPFSVDDHAEWLKYKIKFISNDGRVIDTGNGNVSHSEGQGWGMLFSVAFNDQETFDKLYNWTSRHLSRQHDALHAWRYLPNTQQPVPDGGFKFRSEHPHRPKMCRVMGWQFNGAG